MTDNGDGRTPRPSIEMMGSPAASAAEAAAVVAAVEQFLADTAPTPQVGEPVNPWQRAALLDGVRSKNALASPWGEGMRRRVSWP